MDPTKKEYSRSRVNHWDRSARAAERWRGLGGYYRRRLKEIYRFIIPPGQKVLEIGCGTGDLLAEIKPARGVGIDFSWEMIRRASKRHPHLSFILADAHDLPVKETFDFIILSDLVNDLWDVQSVLQQLLRVTDGRSRIIVNFYSRLWETPLLIAKKTGLGRPLLFQNWLTVEDMDNLLHLADMEIIRRWDEILWPLSTPLLSAFFNKIAVRIWPFHWFSLSHMVVARQIPMLQQGKKPLVSVIIPARNEAGNISQIFSRTPEMGSGTELLFVEGHSSDDTYEEIKNQIQRHPHRPSLLLQQSGEGKGDAVRMGFAHARGDILMILDADLTVPPEDLPRFYDVLVSGKGDFANGVRLVYPMEKEAMRFFNLVGNKFFSLAFTWLLGQPVKDTLCGTKALRKKDYERISANRSYFGDFDPFGDFDLLFGAAKMNLKIREVPVRYRDRQYGSTNIRRWTHGWLLLKMVFFALKRLKFV
jgi:SAM-dependent methyltransferase